jgi:hypothetical protein
MLLEQKLLKQNILRQCCSIIVLEQKLSEQLCSNKSDVTHFLLRRRFKKMQVTFFSFSAAWGYHKQGYCQAGFSTLVTQVSLNSVGALRFARITFDRRDCRMQKT